MKTGGAPGGHPAESRAILFICTGNYYRSRFAEALFNHRAREKALSWKAFSRGLAIHLAEGPLSVFTEEALQIRGIDRNLTAPDRVSLTETDLVRADLVIALKRDEHHAMMKRLFPEWADRITYWAVHDLDQAAATQAFREIEEHVGRLLDDLHGSRIDISPVRDV